jgi:hypothetical protein
MNIHPPEQREVQKWLASAFLPSEDLNWVDSNAVTAADRATSVEIDG